MKFYIKEKIFSIGDNFNIMDFSGKDVFYVKGKIFSMGNKLRIYDIYDNELVYIEKKLFKLFPEYSIYLNGMYAAKVKKEFSFFKPSFNIDSSMGNYDIKGDFFAHDFYITKNGVSVARITKTWLSWGDSYEIDIDDEENYVFILALVIIIDQVLYDNNRNNN